MTQYDDIPGDVVTRVREGYGTYTESMPELDEHTYSLLKSIEKFGGEAWLSNLKDDIGCKRHYIDNHLPKIEDSKYVSYDARGPAGKKERFFRVSDEGRAAIREYERQNGELTPSNRREAAWTRAEKKEIYDRLDDNERDARYFREELLQSIGDSEDIDTSEMLPIERIVYLLERMEYLDTFMSENWGRVSRIENVVFEDDDEKNENTEETTRQ